MTTSASPPQGVDSLDVLFIGGYDSTNYVYVDVVRELEARGHRCTVLVENESDIVNTKMFASEQIPVTRVADYELSRLGAVTTAFSGQFARRAHAELLDEIVRRGIPLISFANLFSSVTMRVPVDLVIATSEAKFDEFEHNGLSYNMVAVGNPQYDRLVRMRESWGLAHSGPVRKVLVVDQGAYPLGVVGKKQLARTLETIASNNPQMSFHIKPRYMPDEVGMHLHSLSDHLFSHFEALPDNMSVITEAAGIEEIVADFDAMITTWSTAHLNAAALGMPLLLISGLESADVFDVRRQRVAAAYDHLVRTGCVHDWRELLSGAPPFRVVAPEYLKHEFYDLEAPASPRVVDILEALQADVYSAGRVLTRGVRSGYREFMDRRPHGWPTAPLDSPATQLDRALYQRLNPVMQALAFENRCMGSVLDMRRMLPFWERSVTPDEGQPGVDSTVAQAKAATTQLKAEYFAAHPHEVAHDVFIQDQYFDWLLETGQHKKLRSYDGPLVVPESLEFNRGMALLKRGRLISASRNIVTSFARSMTKGCRILLKDKRLITTLEQVDTSLLPHAILFLLAWYRKDAALSAMEIPPRAGVEALVRYRMKALLRLEKAGEARALYEEYVTAVGDTRPMTQTGGLQNAVLGVVLAYNKAALSRLAAVVGASPGSSRLS